MATSTARTTENKLMPQNVGTLAVAVLVAAIGVVAIGYGLLMLREIGRAHV